MKKRKIDIDWVEVMREGGGEEEELPELEVIVASRAPPATEAAPKPPTTIAVDEQMDCEQSFTDRELDERLERHRSLLENMGSKLPDNGEKLRSKLERLEEEKKWRMLRRPKMDVDGCQKLMHSTSSGSADASRQVNMCSKDVSRSTFAAYFCKNSETDTQSLKPFDKELQDLRGESREQKANAETLQKQSDGWRLLSKQERVQPSEKHPSARFKESKGNHKSKESYLKKKTKDSSPYSLVDDDADFIDHNTPREDNLQKSPSLSSRHKKKSHETVINVDEEEPQPSTMEEPDVKLPKGMKEDIYYPSRDDPDVVQVCRKDIECLSPQAYLTSPIMNFYIKYLQHETFSENPTFADCHFFNTYFYKKLIQAVTYKGNDKDAFFVKFRRWWKGIELFRKAYIFIPIHEDVHWSLVIICIPDKEDESGLTILHLDSLGFHSRKSIFDNIKSFLKEEWNYLNQQNASSFDQPISEKIWKYLPRRISEAEIEVPQQKNDYDCGLFVLFFMKRFIEVAPKRLKKKDLEMFDKKWFRPEQASAMRIEIRNILIQLFRISDQTDESSNQMP